MVRRRSSAFSLQSGDTDTSHPGPVQGPDSCFFPVLPPITPLLRPAPPQSPGLHPVRSTAEAAQPGTLVCSEGQRQLPENQTKPFLGKPTGFGNPTPLSYQQCCVGNLGPQIPAKSKPLPLRDFENVLPRETRIRLYYLLKHVALCRMHDKLSVSYSNGSI